MMEIMRGSFDTSFMQNIVTFIFQPESPASLVSAICPEIEVDLSAVGVQFIRLVHESDCPVIAPHVQVSSIL